MFFHVLGVECIHAGVDAKDFLGFFSVTFPLSFETGSLTDPEASQFD